MAKKKKILVVDDEPDNASIFTMGLEDGGFEVDAFTDPLFALSNFKLCHKKYDLLILDIKMSDMNGFELFQEIRKIDNKVKACFLTAYGEGYTEEFGRRFSSSINVSFIRKPIRVNVDVNQPIRNIVLSAIVFHLVWGAIFGFIFRSLVRTASTQGSIWRRVLGAKGRKENTVR